MTLRITLSAVLIFALGQAYGATNAAAVSLTPEAAARFLEQATWGPAPADVAHLQQVGFQTWLNEQFAAPPGTFPAPDVAQKGIAAFQDAFFLNAIHGPDQLRQRVAFALSELWVVSAANENSTAWITPYWELLLNGAFGNYRGVMKDMTLDPGMGRYLNMVNNNKADPQKGTTPNENYGRETMQLFTLGVNLLNADGSLQLDSAGQPIPTYSQADVVSFSRALTGWTYPPKPGRSTPTAAGRHNPEYYLGAMAAVDANHDTDAKTLLNGAQLPAGQSAEQDLDGVLDDLMNHPNIGPFVAKQLIQHLVSSNPSPAYVQRIAGVFADDGTGQRGNLRAVVQAILLDPEARAGDDPTQTAASGGHLREPVLFITTIYRMLHSGVSSGYPGSHLPESLGQELFYEPSVFSYFSPQYRLPATGLPAPEFQIHSSATAVAQANLAAALVGGKADRHAKFDFSPFVSVAGNNDALTARINQTMLHGTMSPELRIAVEGVLNSGGSARTKVKSAIALVAASPEFAVEK